MSANPLLPAFVTDFLQSASPEQKQSLLSLLTTEHWDDLDIEMIDFPASDQNDENDLPVCDVLPSSSTPQCSKTKQISDFVQHIDNLNLDNELADEVLKELATMNLTTRGKGGRPAKVLTKWLSPSSENYCYGKVCNKPQPIADFPNIVKLMDIVNSTPSTSMDMNACLVSCMSTAASNLSYHSDNEALIAQDSDICTVSFGPPRTLDFVWNESNPRGRKGKPPPPDYTIPANNHSMNIMKAGCQSMIQHRVPPGKKGGVRYSISFRRIAQPQSIHGTSKSPSPSAVSVPATPPTNTSTSSVQSAEAPRQSPPKKKIVLMAGDSFFQRLDEKKLAKGKQTVFNVAKGGNKIEAVEQSIKKFVDENPELEIKKLFICVGTNDIRNCHHGIYHLKGPLQKLMAQVKLMAPTAKIWFQSLLPIPSNGSLVVVRNVVAMNSLLYDLCSRNRLLFIDVFRSFLNRSGSRNFLLFPKYDIVKKLWDIHPNARGMGVLARHYIFLIHTKWFNPLGY